jgi:signal transduction histidine kinase
MKHSLGFRLVLSFLGVIVLTVAIVVVLANRITANRFTYLVSRAGQAQAQSLAPLFADYYLQAGSWNGVDGLVEQGLNASANPMGRGRRGNGMFMAPMMGMMNYGGDRLLLADRDGKIVADSADQNANQQLSTSDLANGAPITVRGEQVGTLIVASGLGTLTSEQNDFLSQVNRLLVIAGVVAGVAVLFVGSLQARRILAPVKALAEAARRLADGDLAQRVAVSSHDELGEMADAFNRMAAQLEQQHALRRRAMADVAHELRTPLSVLQIDLESIEDGLTAPTADVIARLQEEVRLLNGLVDDLRMLSLAEAGELQLTMHPLDLSDLVRTTAERVHGAAREKEITLSVELPDGLPIVVGDRQRLAQVLLNLLSNALRHTPPNGQIHIAARSLETTEVQISVQDDGEGIPQSELTHIFERFYRTDHGRGRDTGGSGLGLSIALSLIEAHGGRIWADSAEGQGSTFAFVLPVSDTR